VPNYQDYFAELSVTKK